MDSIFMMFKLNSNTLTAPSTTSINIGVGSTYTNIIGKVFEIWPHLNINDLDLLYTIPRYENCRLHNEADVACLFGLVYTFSLRVVDVLVSSRSTVHGLLICSTSETCVEMPQITCSDYFDPSKKVMMSHHWSNYLKGVGQKFHGGINEFRTVLKKYGVKLGYDYKLVTNHKKAVKGVCLGKGTRGEEKFNYGCWSITASIESSTKAFVIRKWNNIHECDLEIVTEKGMNLSSKIIANLINDKVREKQMLRPADVVDHMKGEYGFKTTYMKAYTALSVASEKVFGDVDRSYNDLRWYVAVVLAHNPSSRITVEVDETTNKFQLIFVAFGACICGFAYIRLMLFIDGTHLSGKYLGILFCATGKNENQELYPLAFAIVDSETTENWFWFLTQLRYALSEEDRRLSFFSDRNLGLLNAVPRVFLEDEHDHYFYLHHMKENLKVKFSSGGFSFKKENILKLFGLCAYAPTVLMFDRYMTYLLKEDGQTIKDFLQGVPEKKWAKAFSVGCRFGEMMTNVVESLNSWILDCRGLPIVHCIEGIQSKLMKWHHERKLKSDRWTTVLCKEIGKRICDRFDEVRAWGITRYSLTCFEVRSTYSFVVDVETRFCSCGRCQIDKFPCYHVLACFMRTQDLDLHLYIDSYIYTSEYRKAYEETIYPVPSSLKEQYEPIGMLSVLPPSIKRPPGRPTKNQMMLQVEIQEKKINKKKNRKFTYSRCHQQGHSKKTCKETLS